eukprot:CAMPEP_0177302270 /NCGR_PEP_ID=MMETSP0368-20130122/5503_1 /TAXON_ID=447022 ORGANISM="Scrippsiella hangoei-like, Strain SHHI-4" /NCGR_SAMPLE_ID=MMETSP0368 /ASSEMBLY_ACC=CAM_ASM_000363 /LENGTH=50 /DNA_ID=CAMNT_0018760725 /DNA_START=67 /DNA_END=216 /DNA_ORIENTATION=-
MRAFLHEQQRQSAGHCGVEAAEDRAVHPITHEEADFNAKPIPDGILHMLD